jgi:glycosyltransferase involved in cell wall biosynthesis
MNCRVCVDDRWASAHGISRYSTELISRIEAKLDIVKIARDCSIRDPLTPWKLTAAIRRAGADVFWSPGFVPPASRPLPFVFTIHDLTYVRAGGSLHRTYFNWIIKPLCRKAQKVVTVSEYSRAEICEWADLPAEQVSIVSNGVAATCNPDGPRYNPGFPYFLYVGNHLPHKNLERALRAFALSGLAGELCFLLTGDTQPELAQLATSLGIHKWVRFIGKVEESELPSYYRGATAAVLLSTHEGFGLPVVEAMASGIPVLAANATSLPEIAGGAAVLVHPLQVEEMADGMGRIATDGALREKCRRMGLEQSRRFNWDNSADQLTSILTEAALTDSRSSTGRAEVPS